MQRQAICTHNSFIYFHTILFFSQHVVIFRSGRVLIYFVELSLESIWLSILSYVPLGCNKKWYASCDCPSGDASKFNLTKSVFIYCRGACVIINARMSFVLLPCTPGGNGPSINLWCFISRFCPIAINLSPVIKWW